MHTEFRTAFDWSSGVTWIMDGDRRVAALHGPRLHDLVLQPEAGPSVTWLTLFWWQYANNEQPGRSAWLLDQLSCDDRDPACYRLLVRTHNAGRSVTSECALELTFDPAFGSYVYDVKTRLEVQPGKEWRIEPQGGVEFADPWYRQAVGSATDFEGAQPARWKWVVYPDHHNRLVRLPLNHLGSPALERIEFPPDGGWLGFAGHPAGNPVIELDAETAAATRAEVCAWGYDVHFIHQARPGARWDLAPYETEQLYSPVTMQAGDRLSAHYRLYSLPYEQIQAKLSQATTPPLSHALTSRLERPALELPVSSFQTGIDPAQPSSAWYWSPSNPHNATWERNFGRSDQASLRVKNSEDRLAYWEVQLGPDFWMGPLPTQPQRLSVWIKTRQAQGAGATISFRYSNYRIETGQQPPLPAITSPSVRGDRDWIRVELVVEPVPQSELTRAYLRMALNGFGEAWFDDLQIEPLT